PLRLRSERIEDRTSRVGLADRDDRLDLVWDEAEHPGLPDAGGEHSFGEWPEEGVRLLRVVQRQLEEAQRREVELTRLHQPRSLAELQPFLGGRSRGLGSTEAPFAQ